MLGRGSWITSAARSIRSPPQLAPTGRIHQIAEHHRNVPAFAGGFYRRRDRRRLHSGRDRGRDDERRSGHIKLGDRAQELTAVAEQDFDILEVLIRQIGQNAEVNPILGKRAGRTRTFRAYRATPQSLALRRTLLAMLRSKTIRTKRSRPFRPRRSATGNGRADSTMASPAIPPAENEGQGEAMIAAAPDMLKALRTIEFDVRGRCTACFGWDGSSENDHKHANDCIVASAIASGVWIPPFAERKRQAPLVGRSGGANLRSVTHHSHAKRRVMPSGNRRNG